MFEINSGYVGASRSVRSQDAIESYEVPISMINSIMIENFLNENNDEFSPDDLTFLKTVTVAKWKFVACEKTRHTSWHHTSSYFNKTNHYDLLVVAENIIAMKDTLDADYQAYRVAKKGKASNYKYGFIKVQVWGGTRKRPKLIGYHEVAGIIIGDWLYYKENHNTTDTIGKYKTTANKVDTLETYNSYGDLVKNHKEFKSTKRVFNKIISEKGVK